jgi:uncharacterized protein
MPSPAVPAPTADPERLTILDALRGFALGGIFLLNLASFTGFVFMTPEQMAALPTAVLDRPAALLIVWLGYGKFYSLFSLLFGIGFALQLAAADRHGDAGLRVFRRRLLVLLAIGAVHLYLWEGDILFFYALIGFLLIPLRHLSDKALLRTAAMLVMMPVVLQLVIVLSHGALDPGAPLVRAGDATLQRLGFEAGAQPYPVLRDAGWSEYLKFQLSGVFFRYADLLTTGRPFKVLAMFLLGLWVGRSGMLRDLSPWVPTLRRVRGAAFGIGLPFAALQALLMLEGSPATSALEALAYALGVAPVAIGYACSFALLWQSSGWRARLERLAPAGRMALTNYLMQTAISLAVFYGIGLGQMGRVGPIWWPLIVAATLAIQVGVSRWWLMRFAFGPMEWLWRQATYGRRLPMRRPERRRIAHSGSG